MTTQPPPHTHDERLRRWRLLLGGEEADGTGCTLSANDTRMDNALDALYDSERRGGLGSSSPNIARWLGDIRAFFPSSVVQVMQRDAIERLKLHKLLMEPELLEAITPDIHLVANIMALSRVMPERTRNTARKVVQQVLDELKRKLYAPMQQAVVGSLNRQQRNRHPRFNEIDWHRTIRANLKNYQPDYHTVIPDTLIGFGRKRSSLRDIILCIDQSGSMATSVVYASIFGAVLASLPAINTRLVVFDTAVVDLTAELHDPVDVLFGINLGGGTDINHALGYCQQLVQRPNDTVLILISDLFEGGNSAEMMRRAATLVGAGVQLIVLLALSDDGAPSFHHQHAEAFAALGSPGFACTPNLFPDLMAAALQRQDIAAWAATNNIVTV